MLVTLMRHGIAESFARSDADRRLTDAGERIVDEVILGLKSCGWCPGAIVCSPLTRSRQTAAVALKHFPGTPLDVLPAVVEADEALLAELGARELIDPLVIGHEPGLSRLAGSLLGARGVLHFQPATVACLRVDALPPRTPAELLFLAPPLFARLFQ
jgi:phosphohistidine phosphatase